MVCSDMADPEARRLTKFEEQVRAERAAGHGWEWISRKYGIGKRKLKEIGERLGAENGHQQST